MRIFMAVLLFMSFTFVSCTDEEVTDSEEKEDKTPQETVDENGEVDEEPETNDEGNETIIDDDLTEKPDENETSGYCTDYDTVFPLQPGDCVPDFTLPAQDGVTMVKLSDHRGKYVLFSSFPMANTPVCTGQMQKLDEMYDDFIAENIMPFGLNNESPDKKESWCETMGIVDLLILADHDPKDAVSIMFGINGFNTARANTVIGPDGRFIMKKACANSTCIPEILQDIKDLK